MKTYVGGYCMMATIALFFVSITLDVATLIMPQWLVQDDPRISKGLWRECTHSDDAQQCVLSERSTVENLVVSFLVLSVFLKAPALLLAIVKSWRFDQCRVPLTVATGVADAMNIAAVCIYAAYRPPIEHDTSPTFGLSFQLSVANAVLAFILTIACWHVFLTKEILDNAPKTMQQSSRTQGTHNVHILF